MDEDFVYTIDGVDRLFRWDVRKRELNLQKHGVDFTGVPKVFKNPLIECLDQRVDYGEDRWIVLGWNLDSVLVIVLTYDNGARRLISARKGNKHEEKYYFAKRPH